jgi:ELWxxDGT repeat protein
VLVRDLPVYPGTSTDVDGRLFFTASFSNDVSLWTSDGTRSGTRLVRAWPWPNAGGPQQLTEVNGLLYFAADDESHGRELWRSDGTLEGTTMVADVLPGSGNGIGDSSFGPTFAPIGASLFLPAEDGVHGLELWVSDGTPQGTTLVDDVDDPRTRGSYPGLFTDVNGTVFFAADDGAGGAGLWKTTGLAGGSALVRSFDLGSDEFGNPGGFGLAEFTNVDDTLFFAAYDETTGAELWKSDGTPAGTTIVKDLAPGAAGSYPHALIEVDGVLYFWAEGLWKSDGTGAGTKLVKGLTGDAQQFVELEDVGGTVYFVVSSCCGADLWKSDGNEAGTVLVTRIPVGPAYQFTDVNGTLFFGAGDELWRSDGTEAGTVSLAGGIYPTHLTDVHGTLFFALNRSGRLDELWTSDGTDAGTVRVKDVPGKHLGQIADLEDAGGTVFFTVIRDRYEPIYRAWLELWRSDGTRRGTVLVRTWPRPAGSLPQDLTAVHGMLFFTASDGASGLELWASDGTAAGTVLVSDIRSGRQGSKPTALSSANGTLFFGADDGLHGVEPWVLAP